MKTRRELRSQQHHLLDALGRRDFEMRKLKEEVRVIAREMTSTHAPAAAYFADRLFSLVGEES